MGILLNAAYLMMIEAKREPFRGRVLQLGRQEVLFNHQSLAGLAQHAGFTLTDIGVTDPMLKLTDEQFFRAIGFTEVLSLEYCVSESATYVWDLNHLVPDDWDEQFDFIYDGGTLEHIFHIPNTLESICRMLKVGGRVAHDNGVSGSIDHGFYAIQPTLYHDYYSAQQFQTDLFTVSKIKPSQWYTHTGEQAPYTPGMYDYSKTWAFDAESAFVAVCFATKKQPFTGVSVPQQSLWSRG